MLTLPSRTAARGTKEQRAPKRMRKLGAAEFFAPETVFERAVIMAFPRVSPITRSDKLQRFQ